MSLHAHTEREPVAEVLALLDQGALRARQRCRHTYGFFGSRRGPDLGGDRRRAQGHDRARCLGGSGRDCRRWPRYCSLAFRGLLAETAAPSCRSALRDRRRPASERDLRGARSRQLDLAELAEASTKTAGGYLVSRRSVRGDLAGQLARGLRATALVAADEVSTSWSWPGAPAVNGAAELRGHDRCRESDV